MSEVVLRRASAADAEAIAALGRATYVETFVEDFEIPYPEPDLRGYLDTTFAIDKIRGQLTRSDEAWWVAERGDEIVGFANAGPMTLPHPEGRTEHAELRRLYVARRAQGAGIGKRLLETALAWMVAHTKGPLWLGVWSGNERAQKLYTAYGFRKYGEYKYPVGTWFDDEHIWRRD